MVSTVALPFLQKPVIPTTIRDSFATLLGPRPQVKITFGPPRSVVMHAIEIQTSALFAYKAKVDALMNILESVGKDSENDPEVIPVPRRRCQCYGKALPRRERPEHQRKQ
jgi:hypothetical protein